MTTEKTKILILLILLPLTCFYFLKINRPANSSLEEFNLSIIPEYERSLEEITLTIPEKTASYQETLLLLNAGYANLLLNIPNYTKISIFTHTVNKEILAEFISTLGITNEITYYFSDNSNLEMWAQDCFEPVNNGFSDYLLLPKTTTLSTAFTRIYKRNMPFKNSEKSLTAPFFFEGGNILAAKSSLGSFIFIDFDSIKKTQDLYKLNKQTLFNFQIKNLVKRTFPASKIIVLGDKRRIDNFIHLDQSVLFLKDNVVVINSINDAPSSEAATQHILYKKQLERLGFETKTLPISLKDVENSMSPLNAIVYKNSLTKENTVIFPVYPGEIKTLVKEKKFLKKEDLRGNALEAFVLFSELGYVPVPVFDDTLYKRGGSLHCISNVTR